MAASIAVPWGTVILCERCRLRRGLVGHGNAGILNSSACSHPHIDPAVALETTALSLAPLRPLTAGIREFRSLRIVLPRLPFRSAQVPRCDGLTCSAVLMLDDHPSLRSLRLLPADGLRVPDVERRLEPPGP